MSKIIVLGDTHGRSFWKQVALTQTYDKLILLGDYCDSYDFSAEEEIKNLREIIAHKEANPDTTILLLGNHDFHYLPVAVQHGDRYSGFRESYCRTISVLFQTNMHLFKMAHLEGEFLMTHAGITKTWLNSTMRLPADVSVDFGVPVDEYVNTVWKNSPEHFLFNGVDHYGDDKTQSPIWVRPSSLNEDAINYTHVVGHTKVKRIGVEPVEFLEQGKGMFIDTLDAGEYLIIEDGVPKVGKLFGPEPEKLKPWHRHKEEL